MAPLPYLYRLLCIYPFTQKLGPEALIQYRFVSMCRVWSISGELKAVWFSVPNEIANKKNPVFGKKLQALGKINGVADMIFLWEGGCGCLEFKDPHIGKISENQKLFQKWCEDKGVAYRIVKSVLEAVEVVTEWGVLPEEERDSYRLREKRCTPFLSL